MKLQLARSRDSLSPAQIQALVFLLGDEDPAVHGAVRDKLLSYGQAAADWLQPSLISDDPVRRRHAREIIDFLGKRRADNAFLGFCLTQGEDFSIEEGALHLARTQFPHINPDGYRAMLDSFATDLLEEIDPTDETDQILATLNDYLFRRQGFTGNETDYYDPDNSYLNRVLDRRTGNPISLALIYLLIGRRLSLPLTGIGLPGHFVCRYQTTRSEVYVDAFNGGKILTKADCIKYLLHTKHSLQEGHLAPVSSRRILLRICANLHSIYAAREALDETARIQRYLVALAK